MTLIDEITELQEKYSRLLTKGEKNLPNLRVDKVKYQVQKKMNSAWKQILQDLMKITEKPQYDSQKNRF